jgi:hypothetical protein
LWIASACSEPADPVGTYRTTAASFAAAFRAFQPSDEMRERFETVVESSAAAHYGVELALRADHTFSLRMTLPMVQEPQTESGTWRSEGPDVVLETAAADGEPPRTTRAAVTADRLILQVEPQSPRFELEKVRP